MSKNRLFISAAGSGKTTRIVKEAIDKPDENILITTFTNENEKNIRKKFIQLNRCVPPNITITTWFSFLIKHGLKPYRYWDIPVKGLFLVNGRSNQWIPESNFYSYYFYDKTKIYSDKLSKLVCKCNVESNGSVIRRLERLFPNIYIDEIQDMSGFDYDILKLIINSSINLTMVGDPRQCVYTTHFSQRYHKYSFGKIVDFVKNECPKYAVEIDDVTLNSSYRNSMEICTLANRLFPEYQPCGSNQQLSHEHKGIFYIKEEHLRNYMLLFKPFQLRWDRRVSIICPIDVMNFGEAKGSEFDHIVIYPPRKFLEWLYNNSTELSPITRSKLYVAITRAFFSIGIVVKNNNKHYAPDIPIWE